MEGNRHEQMQPPEASLSRAAQKQPQVLCLMFWDQGKIHRFINSLLEDMRAQKTHRRAIQRRRQSPRQCVSTKKVSPVLGDQVQGIVWGYSVSRTYGHSRDLWSGHIGHVTLWYLSILLLRARSLLSSAAALPRTQPGSEQRG